LSKSHSNISDADNDALAIGFITLPSWLSLTTYASSFNLEGTPTLSYLGSCDINITVTDGKIPVHINFTLNVNPSAESLPDGFTFANGVYTHTVTVRTLSGDVSIEIVNGGVELTQSCVNNKMTCIGLDSNGLLSTGFKDCTSSSVSDVLTETFTSTYQTTQK